MTAAGIGLKIAPMRAILRPIGTDAAADVVAGCAPDGMTMADDYPTEFSLEVAERVDVDHQLGPYFIHRCDDDVVVGEIGGSLIERGTIMIGYAVVESCWARGYATDAVREFVSRARRWPGTARRRLHAAGPARQRARAAKGGLHLRRRA